MRTPYIDIGICWAVPVVSVIQLTRRLCRWSSRANHMAVLSGKDIRWNTIRSLVEERLSHVFCLLCLSDLIGYSYRTELSSWSCFTCRRAYLQLQIQTNWKPLSLFSDKVSTTPHCRIPLDELGYPFARYLVMYRVLPCMYYVEYWL